MQQRDHTELLTIHILIGIVTSLFLALLGGVAVTAAGTPLPPIRAALGASLVVLIVASIMAWTPILRRFGLDFRGEPLDDRVVVTAAYVIAVVTTPMLADAVWSPL